MNADDDRAAYIAECVDNSPPLTPGQIARLQAVFAANRPEQKRIC